ncbi:MAG: SPOR domain-containing protein [Gammaproteobacteria bacterium]|nr:SPOR domain-containing protein [Gammaproteobacteria bacterium]
MRLFLFLLLFLNLSGLAWYFFLAPKATMAYHHFPVSVDELKLVMERSADETESSSEHVASTPSVEVLIKNSDAKSNVATISEREMSAIEEEVGEGVLLSKTESDGLHVTLPKSCFSLGPFTDLDAVKSATSKLAEQQIEVTQRELKERYLSSYQVYLSALPTLAKAKKVTEQLKQKKIRDYYIILKRGAQRYAISLGLFKDKKHALRRMILVKKRGFQPKMLSRFRTRQLYWLDYTGVEEPIDLALLQGKEEKSLQRLERACN